MSLEVRKSSKWWYGRWMANGKRHCVRLDVRVKGEPGEKRFEESREAADEALKKVKARYREMRRPEDLVQEIHRVKFGHKIGSIPLSGLFEAWREIPRKREPGERHLGWAQAVFRRLLEYVEEFFPRVKELSAVDRKVAEGFMRHESARKISPRTFNAELVLLRGCFEHLREDAGMLSNPFRKIVTKESETIHREPFTQEELIAVLGAAKDDPLIYPLVVIGVCSAMRRGDCCLLKWKDVDLTGRFVRVKTSKTGGSVEIPMFSMLEDLLRPLAVNKAKSPYVLPELAAMYTKNPYGINWRLKQVFEKAGFVDADVYEARKKKEPKTKLVHRGDVHVALDKRSRSACLRGFHSFRVTWITVALSAGVPMELVTRVTGHQTVDVVLKHYFKPGREDFRQAIEGAMPKMLTGYDKTIDVVAEDGAGDDAADSLEQALRLLKGVTGKANKKRVAEAMKLIRGAKVAAKV